MPRALIISFVEWAGAFQRPQHQAVELARLGWDVTYLGPAYPHRGAAGLGAGFELPEKLKLRTARAMPGGRIFSVLERYNETSFRREVTEMTAKAQGSVWDAVIFNDPRWAEAASAARARVRVWDRMDDLSESAPTEAWGRERESDALQLADIIWTGTPSLAKLSLEQLKELGLKKSVKFVPCGTDFELFSKTGEEEAQRARVEMGGDDGPQPVGLYFGAINDRLNGKFIEALLDAGWKVALIGPGSSRAPRLRASEGLRLLGPRPYDALPAYLAGADAGLIPYHVEGAHRHLYPVKALEYLAGAKPVLTTPLPNIVNLLGDFVWTGELPEDWGKLADNWKKMKSVLETKALEGQAFVRERTWAAMADEMVRELIAAGSAIRKEGRGDAVRGVRPAGSEDLKTQAGSKAAKKRKKKSPTKGGTTRSRGTKGGGTKSEGTKSNGTKSGGTKSGGTKANETGSGKRRGRKTKSGETRGTESQTRETKSREAKKRQTKANETGRREAPVKPAVPPRKFDVRGKDDWGSQSLLERLGKKIPPDKLPQEKVPAEDKPESSS